MTPYSLNPSAHETPLSQFVVIERCARGLHARITCPVVGQREAPIIAGEVAQAIANSNYPRGGALVLDLSSVSMLSSMGLGMCLDLRRQGEQAKLKPHLFGMSRQLLDILRMMKIERHYTVVYAKDQLGAILG
ncbi:MAG: hypothetical protein RL136_2455 [Planctomycetota bacterium]|jgi:anti-anti-sigma regulatory factor